MASDGSFTFWQDGEPPAEAPRPFNPRTKLYDREGNLTGAQIGARKDGGSRYPSGKLELRPYPGPATRGNPFLARMDRAAGQPAGKLQLRPYPGPATRGDPFLARMDRTAGARADGTFDAKRGAYHAGNSGSHMDSSGNIGPRAEGTGAASTPGSSAPATTGGRLQEWSGGMRWVTDQDRAGFAAEDVANKARQDSMKTAGGAAASAAGGAGGGPFSSLGASIASSAANSVSNPATAARVPSMIDGRPAAEAIQEVRRTNVINSWDDASQALHKAIAMDERAQNAEAKISDGGRFAQAGMRGAASTLRSKANALGEVGHRRFEQANADQASADRNGPWVPTPTPSPSAPAGASPAPSLASGAPASPQAVPAQTPAPTPSMPANGGASAPQAGMSQSAPAPAQAAGGAPSAPAPIPAAAPAGGPATTSAPAPAASAAPPPSAPSIGGGGGGGGGGGASPAPAAAPAAPAALGGGGGGAGGEKTRRK